jgi:hypothetical protein
MSAKAKEKRPLPPIGQWIPTVLAAWIVPGAGHFLQKRRGRAGLLLAAVAGMYLTGLMMRGTLFEPQTGDLLTTLIYCGGFMGNLASGMFYFLTKWFGYSQVEVAGHVYDYGTKFLVSAGLLNILAMVDAFEIAAGRKQ